MSLRVDIIKAVILERMRNSYDVDILKNVWAFKERSNCIKELQDV